MRFVFLILLLFYFTTTTFAQREDRYFFWPVDEATQKIIFREVVYATGVSAADLYKSAKIFAYNNFRAEKGQYIIENDTIKTVLAKGIHHVDVPELGDRGKGFITFEITVRSVDNSYKYSITNLEHFSSVEKGVIGGPLENDKPISNGMLFPRRYWEQLREKCYYYTEMLIEQLKESMVKHSKPSVAGKR